MASCRYYTAAVLAAFVCFVTAFPSGGEESKFKCDDECQKDAQKLKDMATECEKKTNCSEEEYQKECSAEVPEKVQLDGNRMINMDVFVTAEQKLDESCEKAPASDDEDPLKSICDNKEAIKQDVRVCIEKGKKEQKEGDQGVAAIMAIRKCVCNYSVMH
ncbi:hypothetical protein R5R35_009007 [Gryllus longicercus]|uniref:Odorant binding protein n=1 Tax=Gryllus longicercus TaxID=2509291 RepID=A0AAN9VH67_9ORTH